MKRDEIVAHYAAYHGLEQALVHAIIMVESAGNTWAVRYEPNMRWQLPPEQSQIHAKACGVSLDTELMCQRTSWGLMQVMGVVARELGFDGLLTKLCDEELGIAYGCKQLERLKKWHKSYSFDDVVASYNAGSPRYTKQGFYENQAYVDKVTAYYSNYKKVGFS